MAYIIGCGSCALFPRRIAHKTLGEPCSECGAPLRAWILAPPCFRPKEPASNTPVVPKIAGADTGAHDSTATPQLARLIRGLLEETWTTRPTPWRIEHDWLTSVESPGGRVFAGTDEDCRALIALREELGAEHIAGEQALKEIGLD